jgi:hypothetical protein
MICARCGTKSPIYTISFFNTDEICLSCLDVEQRHPDYAYAVEIEGAQVLSGNFNYPGIGWPGAEGRVKRQA